jgi:UDP-GlcNAc:undecaprenyl-phosphate/decaprenyl-phosphate GlcNAc-1-phosphate transferase
MGDSGAMLLGLMMAVATISGVGRNANGPSGGDFAAIAIPIVVPLLVLAVPFLDVLLAIVRRMRRGLRITHADKEHIHHRLLDIGHSHREAVLLMYAWSALISICALAVAFINGRLVVGAIIGLAITAAAILPRVAREGAPRGTGRWRHAKKDRRVVSAVVPDSEVVVSDGDATGTAQVGLPGASARASGGPSELDPRG